MLQWMAYFCFRAGGAASMYGDLTRIQRPGLLIERLRDRYPRAGG